MPFPLLANNASSYLVIDHAAASISLQIKTGDGDKFPSPVSPNYSVVTVEDRRTGQMEIVHLQSRTGDTLTVLRAQEGTSAQNFKAGATVSLRFTAGMITAIAQASGAPDTSPQDGTFYGRKNGLWVNPTKGDVGLNAVDNTPDLAKPVSILQRAAILDVGYDQIEQYANGDNLAVDCKPAFDRMLAAGVRAFRGRPGAVYRYVGQFAVPDDGLRFWLNGSTLRPVYNPGADGAAIDGSASQHVSAEFDKPLSAGLYPLRQFELLAAPPAACVPGAPVWFLNVGGSTGPAYPMQLRYVESVVGTTVTVDRDLTEVLYGDNVYMVFPNWKGPLYIFDGAIDCVEVTGDNHKGICYSRGRSDVIFSDVAFNNIDLLAIDPSNNFGVVHAEFCNRFAARGNSILAVKLSKGASFLATSCVHVRLENNRQSGLAFGMQAGDYDSCVIQGNHVEGDYRTSGDTSFSTRGIALHGGRSGDISNNDIRDFDSGVKLTDVGGVVVAHNRVNYCRMGINYGNIALSAVSLWGESIIAHNIIRNCSQYGINVADHGMPAVTVQGNHLYEIGLHGIDVRCNPSLIEDNVVVNWGRADPLLATYHPIRMVETAASRGYMRNNYAFTDAPTTSGGYWIDPAAVNYAIAGNYCNTTAIYASQPAVPEVFTVNGIAYRPYHAKGAFVTVIGGGAGGGSGRQGAAGSVRNGGSGGAGGGLAEAYIDGSELPITGVTATVGVGGAGGTAPGGGVDSNGNAGAPGGFSAIGIGANYILYAAGGNGGEGGTAVANAGGTTNMAHYTGGAGGASSATGGAGTTGTSTGKAPGGGGGGGGITSANARSAGANGGTWARSRTGSTGQGTGGADTVAGGNATAMPAAAPHGGGGGGGGGAGANGGGGNTGGGGGGGGAALTPASSGAGGNGGGGKVIVRWVFD